MQTTIVAMLVAGAFACGSTAALAVDAWDLASDNDDSLSTTDNTLWHTAPAQIHDLHSQLGATDRDWFLINPRARRSYEVQFLNVTGDARVWATVPQRFALDGTTVLQSAAPLDANNWIVTLRWIHGATNSSEAVRVVGTSGGLSAASNYTIQLRETTQYCARYNNASSQVSVLIIRRTDPDNTTSCNFEVRYDNASGTEVGSSLGTLGSGNTMSVIATSSVPGVGGTSGSAFIAHSCGIGGINAKLVALEPATGFSFDTPCLARASN